MAVVAAKRPLRSPGVRTKKRWAEDPDVVVMLSVRAGDRAAFAGLVDRYWTQVFGRLFRQLGDRQEAEDATQDVFLRLYRSRSRYQPRALFATWLYHITQNVARNAIRSRRRHPCLRLSTFVASNQEQSPDFLLTDQTDSPSRPLERAETAGVIRHAVSSLAGRQRLALELHQFHDRTYDEIAVEMDMSPKAAKSLLYRARNQLRAHLDSLVAADI